MTNFYRAFLATILPLALLSLPSPATAADTQEPIASDKSSYTLFNPTPPELMRELSTDRPDKTESAYTVDAGHFQLEIDLATYTNDHDTASGADTHVDSWSFMPVNFKVGLTNRVDLQTVVETYSRTTIDDRVGGTEERQGGLGDVTSRLKLNLWGNDGGKTAMAIMPFVKWPTSQDDIGNDSIEGGVIVPLAVALPAGFGMGVMMEIDVNQDATGDGRHLELINSITFSHDIVGKLGGYAELFGAVSAEDDSSWIGTFDVGLTYGFTANIQLDAGVNFLLNDAADDINPFIGLALRF